MMRTLWTVPFAVLIAATAATSAAGAGELRATIRNVKPQGGTVMVALYDTAEAYKAEKRLAGQMLAPVAGELVVVFANLPPGRYGLSAFQDSDGNGRITSNLLGIPTEPYGFSRGAAASFGPPAFEAFAVTVEGNTPAATELPLTP